MKEHIIQMFFLWTRKDRDLLFREKPERSVERGSFFGKQERGVVVG